MKSNLFWRILGYDIEKYKIELKQINSLSEEKFWELQLRKRDSILMHHLENSPWYKNFKGYITKIDTNKWISYGTYDIVENTIIVKFHFIPYNFLNKLLYIHYYMNHLNILDSKAILNLLPSVRRPET